MKWNFKWGKNNKREMTPELTERGVNVYHHENKIQGAEHLGQKKCAECGQWFTPTHYKEVCCSPACKHVRHRRNQNEWQHKNYEQKKQERVEPAEDIKEEKGESEMSNKPMKQCIICGEWFTPYRTTQQVCFKKECRMEKARRDTRAWYHKHNAEKEEVYQAGLQAKREAYRAKREAEGKPYSPRYTNRKPKTFASVSSDTEQSLAMETTKVVRKLIESGVDDDVVAKYLQTVYGK